MSAADARANIIRGCKLKGPYSGGEDKISIEEVSVNEVTWENDLDTAEANSCTTTSVGIQDSRTQRHVKNVGGVSSQFSNQKDFSRPLLPSEVCFMPVIFE